MVRGLARPGHLRRRDRRRPVRDEYWNDKPTLAAADRIVIGTGSTATANAALAAARTISGTVTGPTGTALADADVTVESRYDDGEGGLYWDYYTSATTSATGTWTAYVPPGTYRVEFQRSGHLTEWWNDAASAAAAQSVVVSTADVGSINAQLAAAAVLRGRVFGPDGPVFGQVRVYPCERDDLASAPGPGHGLHRLQRRLRDRHPASRQLQGPLRVVEADPRVQPRQAGPRHG